MCFRHRRAMRRKATKTSSAFRSRNAYWNKRFWTYGITLETVFLNVDLAIGSYRRAVGTSSPPDQSGVANQKEEIRKELPGVTRKFLYNLSLQLRKELGFDVPASVCRRGAGCVVSHRTRAGPFKALATAANAGTGSHHDGLQRLHRPLPQLLAAVGGPLNCRTTILTSAGQQAGIMR